MNRRIIIVLGAVVIIGMLALYGLKQGPAILLKPPSEQRIAFISDRGGNPDIWTMKTDGSDARQVTNDAADDQSPSWSPDVKQLVSVSDRRDQTYQLFVAAWDGRYVRCITSSGATKDVPVWSADGKEITFISGGKACGIKTTGGREEQYLPPTGTPGMAFMENIRYVFGAWSPSNDYLFYVQETDQGKEVYAAEKSVIMSFGEQGNKPIPIVLAHNVHVAVAPKGAKIAVSYTGRNEDNGIVVADIAQVRGRGVYKSSDSKHTPGKVAWSPDGSEIAFEVWTLEDGTANIPVGIYVVNTSGGKPRLILKGDAREPTWSPDGKQLACTVMSDDKRDIWRVNADGTGAVNLTKGRGDNLNPAWSPR